MSEAEETEEVNEMLIDAIKAKLAILDSMDDWKLTNIKLFSS